jgi:hypothetical protein
VVKAMEKPAEYQLAELNVAKFRLPQDDPANADFVNNLDRVNAIAESQPGFVWRFTGAGNDALDVQAFDDPNIASNLSVWSDLDSLVAFAFNNEAHRDIMRRRREWFDKMDFYVVLWWVEYGHTPTLDEAKARLELLRSNGPSPSAFTFRESFPAPG